MECFIGLFLVLLMLELFVFVCLLILGGLKVKRNILIIKHTCKALVFATLIKMDIKSLEIKTKINYNWDDIIYINDFNADLLEIIKRESNIRTNIYHIGYVLDPDYDYNTIKPLYFVVGRLIGYIEEIERSSDKYLVVARSVRNKNIISVLDMVWTSIEDEINPGIKIIIETNHNLTINNLRGYFNFNHII